MMRMAGFAVVIMVIVVIISPGVYGKRFSDHREIEVQSLLQRLNKPALKSIKSEDGDTIDCILITSQPAFDHPLLKNHTMQMRPSFIPEVDSKHTKRRARNITQVWHRSGECPDNTVSIRRTKKEDILRAKSIESFGKKAHQSIPEDTIDPSTGHEYAIMGSKNGNFYGTKFVMNVWNPNVQVSKEFSLAQTWLTSGDRANLNTIEAGLQVYPEKYGDYNTRLFVYWTNNGYHDGSGCYNMDCPGFVQRSNIFTVGGSLTPVSQYDGDQAELSMLIWKDGENWWLKIGEELVGYWPGSLYTFLGDGATKVEWGGEITNYKTDGKHTATDMGSGHFADEGFKKASYFKNLMVVDGTNSLKEPEREGLYTVAGNENCYNVKPGNGGSSTWGLHFFYGGPGQNDKCL